MYFENGFRQALAWAISTSAREGYVSPSVARMMGAPAPTSQRMTMTEQHGEAAYIIGLVERQPEPYQAAIWFRAGVLPRQIMERLADLLVPHITGLLPASDHNAHAVQMAILKTAGLGPGCRGLAKAIGRGHTYAASWATKVAEAMDKFGNVAEADIEREMVERGWI